MQNSQDRLKELLIARRTEVPGDDYFNTVLPEFHRRLRAQSIKQSSLVEIVWERFHQSFVLDLSRSWRYAGATCVALVACGIAFYQPTGSTEPHLLTLDNPSLQKPSVEYSLAEAGDMNLTSKIDQQLDRVSLSDERASSANFLATGTPAHYVLTNHPVTYDTQVAF